MDIQTDMPSGLFALERGVARERAMLQQPPPNWTAAIPGPDGAPMLDVAVVGAGMCGIAAAAALLARGLRNIMLFDRSDEGREGPWVTTARMETLRSPKHLPGIPGTVALLSFRAWYEAQHGACGWDALYKIPNAVWMDYLTWVRRTLALPLLSRVNLRRLAPAGAALALSIVEDGAEKTVYARRVVLATGRGGAGGLSVPPFVDPALWPDRAAHTGEAIDFAALRGARLAVLGAGPSAWDNAATALEHGAASVDMFVRRPVLPQINKGRGSATPGYFEGWAGLDPATKWSLLVYLHDLQAPPPHETVLRTLRQPGFRIHLGTPVIEARRAGAAVALRVGADRREAAADFLILGTGFRIDLAQVPELAALRGDIALWADRYVPPAALRRPALERYPWLGDGFELQERVPGANPALGRIHLFNHGAFASLGPIASDIPGVGIGAERLASRIATAFFREDFSDIRRRLEEFAEPELESTPFFALPP